MKYQKDTAMAKTLNYRIRNRLQKIVKSSYQKLRIIDWKVIKPPRALFVFGAQRSGTRLPMEVMDRSLNIDTYREGDRAAFNKALLKSNDEIRCLLDKNPFPFVAFKPICDSHRAGELLDFFVGTKSVWIFRNYKDVVNSASKKWKDGKKNLINLVSGNLELAGWRAGGLTKEKIQLTKEYYSDNMSSHEAHALMFYLRNSLFFDLKLHERDDMILIRYEDLVSTPEQSFSKIFRFFGCKFKKSFVSGIYLTSIGKNAFPKISRDIENLCESVSQQLLDHYQKQNINF